MHGLRDPGRNGDQACGTGILTFKIARKFPNSRVIGVDLQDEYVTIARKKAKDLQLTNIEFISGRAEATGLDAASVDLVTAGQAFHWFSVPEARVEFERVLRPGGGVALVWNLRRLDSSPFLREYEAFLRRWSTDYEEVSQRYAEPGALRGLFGPGGWREHVFDNVQRFDLEALRGRLLSSSYTPREGDPRRAPMLAELPRLFEAHAREGRVEFEYDTRLFVGRLSSSRPGRTLY